MAGQSVTAESIDRFFAAKMSEYHIPGAVFALIEGGTMKVSAGYGFSCFEREVPVDPEMTGFPISEVSGLFTVIATLRLVEEGLVGIEDDISNYLPEFRVPRSRYGQPCVTNLLNHTDGYEECLLRSAVTDPAKRLSLEEYLNKSMKPIICEPGKYITFGCLSMAIAGYIIEVASGYSCEDYIIEKILEPLGMKSTAFISGPNSQSVREAAVPYELVRGTYEPLPVYYSNIAPADGMMSTGADMAKLIVSLLPGGDRGNSGILNEDSLQKMLKETSSPAPGLPGLTCGFVERRIDGEVILERTGKTPGSFSMVLLAPGLDKGFFLAMNRRDERIKEDLISLVTGEDFKSREYRYGGTAGHAEDTREFRGEYHYVQRSRKTIGRYLSLSKSLLRVEPDESEPGSLKVIPLASGDCIGGFDRTERWRPSKGDLFTDNRHGLIAFTRNESGKVTHLCSGQGLHGCYERLNWYESPGYFYAIAGAYLIFFLLVALISPTWIFSSNGSERWPVALLLTAALLNIIFIVGIQPAVNRRDKTGLLLLCFSNRIDTFLACLLAMTILIAAISSLVVVYTAIAWGWAYWSISSRVFYTVASVLSVMFVFFLSRLRLLGFRF